MAIFLTLVETETVLTQRSFNHWSCNLSGTLYFEKKVLVNANVSWDDSTFIALTTQVIVVVE